MTPEKKEALETPFMQVMRDIREFMIQKRVGNIQVNMFKGNISNWTINETKKSGDALADK